MLTAQIWLSKYLQCARLGAGWFKYMPLFYFHINPIYLHIKDENPTGVSSVMDLIRCRDLTTLRPSEFMFKVIYKLPFHTYCQNLQGEVPRNLYFNGLV